MAVERYGRSYTFCRPRVNQFGEQTDEWDEMGILRGLYHEESNFVRMEVGDAGAATVGKKQPHILCLCQAVSDLGLVKGDHTVINNRRFTVTGVKNVQEWGIVADIMMEAAHDNGVSV